MQSRRDWRENESGLRNKRKKQKRDKKRKAREPRKVYAEKREFNLWKRAIVSAQCVELTLGMMKKKQVMDRV